MTAPILHQVFSIKANDEAGVYVLNVDVTDTEGKRYTTDYCSRPDDTFGLNPVIRAWLSINPAFPIIPYVAPLPPTAEELRARMPVITRRQLRLALVRNGFTLASVEAVIASLPEGLQRDEAQIEWDGTTFERLSPTLLAIAGALAISAEQVDTMWAEAAAI